MNRPHILRTLLFAVALSTAASLGAQLNQSISVEGKYVPEILRIDRVNTFPEALRVSLSDNPLDYDRDGVPTSFRPSLLTMPATAWGASRYVDDARGYIYAGIGSWLNSTLSAGCRIVDNSSTLVGVRLQHNSTSWYDPDVFNPVVSTTADWQHYDGTLGLYATHVFKGAGTLDASIDYHLGHYITPMGSPSYSGVSHMPWQTVNDASFRVKWHSPTKTPGYLQWNAGAHFRYFGYNNSIYPLTLSYGSTEYAVIPGSRQAVYGLDGSLNIPLDDYQTAALDANLDCIDLSGNTMFGRNGGMLTLKPYYRITRGMADVRFGAIIDLSVDVAPKWTSFSFFHFTPEASIAWQSGQVGFYGKYTGGTRLNTLAFMHGLDYYAMPIAGFKPTYTPIDLKAGLNLGPFSGFSIGIEGGFVRSNNTPMGGWNLANAIGVSDSYFGCIDLKGWLAGAKISYSAGTTFGIYGGFTYTPQDAKTGVFNGLDRPKFVADLKIKSTPWHKLDLELGGSWRGDRGCWYIEEVKPGSTDLIIDGDFLRAERCELADFLDVNLAATYHLKPKFSIWARAENLLNRRVQWLPCQFTQGLTFMAGIDWKF